MSTYFNKEWLVKEAYTSWLANGTDKNSAKCLVCEIQFSLSNMGERALVSHMKGKKHNKISKGKQGQLSIGNYYLKPTEKAPCNSPDLIRNASSTVNIKNFVYDDKMVTDAEIIWAMNVVRSNFSLRSCDELPKLFQCMFPDSAVAKNFTFGKDKCAYYINYGLAPYYRSVLVDDIKQSDFFSVSFDESFNKITQSGQMDLVVTFWDNIKQRIQVRYLDSSFMGHSTAKDLLNHFSSKIEQFNASKLLQISMDGPNVNWAFYDLVCNERDENDMSSLINIGSCGLHVIHSAFKNGENATNWKINKILKALYILLHDSPARRADYIEITGSSTFPFMFCGTRWIEDEKVATRAIDIWNNISKLCNFWESLPKYKRPKCKSYETVLLAIKDQLIKAKLNFFSCVARKVQPFLEIYQTTKPMIPFLFEDLRELLKDLLSMFVKPSVFIAAKSIKALINVDLSKVENLLKCPDVGFGANQIINDLLKTDAVNGKLLKLFRNECIDFLRTMIAKLLEKSPVIYSVVRNARSLSPILIATDPDIATKCFKHLLEKLVESKRISPNYGDKTHVEYKQFVSKLVPCKMTLFKDFNKTKDSLDHFYFEKLGLSEEYPQLAHVMKLIFCLGHGQAQVERGFSINKNMLQPNLQEFSLVNRRLVYDFMAANEINPLNMSIDQGLRKSVLSARSKQKQDQEERKKSLEKTEKAKHRELITNDIRKLQSTKKDINKLCDNLEKDYNNLMQKAATEKKSAYIYAVEAVSLKRTRDDEMKKMQKIDESIESLLKKCKQ